jgi:hypothetical protein
MTGKKCRDLTGRVVRCKATRRRLGAQQRPLARLDLLRAGPTMQLGENELAKCLRLSVRRLLRKRMLGQIPRGHRKLQRVRISAAVFDAVDDNPNPAVGEAFGGDQQAEGRAPAVIILKRVCHIPPSVKGGSPLLAVPIRSGGNLEMWGAFSRPGGGVGPRAQAPLGKPNGSGWPNVCTLWRMQRLLLVLVLFSLSACYVTPVHGRAYYPRRVVVIHEHHYRH